MVFHTNPGLLGPKGLLRHGRKGPDMTQSVFSRARSVTSDVAMTLSRYADVSRFADRFDGIADNIERVIQGKRAPDRTSSHLPRSPRGMS